MPTGLLRPRSRFVYLRPVPCRHDVTARVNVAERLRGAFAKCNPERDAECDAERDTDTDHDAKCDAERDTKRDTNLVAELDAKYVASAKLEADCGVTKSSVISPQSNPSGAGTAPAWQLPAACAASAFTAGAGLGIFYWRLAVRNARPTFAASGSVNASPFLAS